MQRCIAECFGTFALVFAGTGAIAVNDLSHGAVTHLGVVLTFGMIVAVMTYSVGDVSGARLNPARSLAPALMSGQLSVLWVYLLAPPVGAGLAIVGDRPTRCRDCCPSRAPGALEGAGS